MKVIITQKGWEGFTGNLGTARFVDGVADIAPVEANRIGAIVQIARLDDENHSISPSADIVRTKHYSAEVQDSRKTKIDPAVASVEDDTSDEDGDDQTRYSREQLEAIADKDGIKGIREISAPLGIKGTSISGLIEEILQRLGE